ncbi:MAG: hypothetical protein Q9175_002832 [Cornicularia normoerica]
MAFSSFVIQSRIAVLALAAPMILELLSPKPEETSNPGHTTKPDEHPIELRNPVTKDKNNLITALVDFHKAQCYFASTIPITALILFRQNQNDISIYLKSNEHVVD